MKTKVKMLTSIAGLPNPTYDLPEHSFTIGETVELHPQLASAWIAGGIAEAVKEKLPAAKGAGKPASSASSNEGEKQEVASGEPPAQAPAAEPGTASASSEEAPAKAAQKPRKS